MIDEQDALLRDSGTDERCTERSDVTKYLPENDPLRDLVLKHK